MRAARIWRPETMLLITRLYIRFWKRRHRSSRFVESRPGHTLLDDHMLVGVPRMLAQSCRPWAEEVRAMLAWHGVDSASTSQEDLWRMYRCGYSASGAAAFA